MTCKPNFQTNALDRYEWPERLRGMVAPLAVWEYCMGLRDRIAKLERELEKARAGGSGE